MHCCTTHIQGLLSFILAETRACMHRRSQSLQACAHTSLRSLLLPCTVTTLQSAAMADHVCTHLSVFCATPTIAILPRIVLRPVYFSPSSVLIVMLFLGQAYMLGLPISNCLSTFLTRCSTHPSSQPLPPNCPSFLGHTCMEQAVSMWQCTQAAATNEYAMPLFSVAQAQSGCY